jgi:hypothetical protein
LNDSFDGGVASAFCASAANPWEINVEARNKLMKKQKTTRRRMLGALILISNPLSRKVWR